MFKLSIDNDKDNYYSNGTQTGIISPCDNPAMDMNTSVCLKMLDMFEQRRNHLRKVCEDKNYTKLKVPKRENSEPDTIYRLKELDLAGCV